MTLAQPHLVAGRAAVRAVLDALGPGRCVVVACSGGADSLALAACLAFEARRRPELSAGAVVVDHGLQSGSAAVAATAGAQCRELGLAPVRVVRARVLAGAGPEDAAREARYRALSEVAPDAVVLLGHTLDDQAETVLLRLARGAGARSLAGMPAARGLLRRPFLGLRRRDTEAICAEVGLDPWTDPTNVSPPDADTTWPLRSRVRQEVLPVLERVLGSGVSEALARTADQLREDDAVLGALAERTLEVAIVVAAHSAANSAVVSAADVVLDPAVLAEQPDAVRRRALRAAAVRAGAPPGALTRTHVLRLDAFVVGWRGQGAAHLPGVRAWRECGRLVLHPTAL
ncbi:MAG: tRNA lysidine(34) synthetase TilS [Cellulomonadaceae bacterium]